MSRVIKLGLSPLYDLSQPVRLADARVVAAEEAMRSMRVEDKNHANPHIQMFVHFIVMDFARLQSTRRRVTL